MTRPCDGCSLCCKVIGIAALAKPPGQWCKHVVQGEGCAIYADKPSECHGFYCFWSMEMLKGEEWKPNRCNLVVWSNDPRRLIIEVDPDHPFAWRREPFFRTIKAWSDRRIETPVEVLVRVKGRMIVIFPEAEIDLGPYDTSKRIVSGYREVDGRQEPFAAYAPADPRA